jgi:hypothetical protein
VDLALEGLVDAFGAVRVGRDVVEGAFVGRDVPAGGAELPSQLAYVVGLAGFVGALPVRPAAVPRLRTEFGRHGFAAEPASPLAWHNFNGSGEEPRLSL